VLCVLLLGLALGGCTAAATTATSASTSAPAPGDTGSVAATESGSGVGNELLDAPPTLLASDPTPVPYSTPLEAAWLPDAARISAEAQRLTTY
jgi:pyruvate/2-oxoglutarate/acetoin dehydrogenase E1 component